MAQWLRMLTALAEDSSLVASSNVEQLTTSEALALVDLTPSCGL